MKVHTAVARALQDNGQDTIFGLLGDANMQYCAEFIDAGGRFVGAVHEGGAVSMADGCARMTGEVTVVTVTHGPGVTNTMTALTEAVRAGSPVLVLTGDTPPRRDFVQHVDLGAAAALCGATHRRVLLAEHVVDDLAKALQHVARTRVPMILDVPHVLLDQDVDYVPSRFTGLSTAVPAPDAEALDVALGILASARKPLVLAGVGAVRAGARDELVALAGRLGAPLATTLLAKDLFAGEAGNLDVFGTVSHDVAIDTISAADCIVAFGASLNDYTAAHGDLLRGKAVIQCDVRPSAIGRYCAVDAAVVGDARLVARAMREQLEAAEVPTSGFVSEALVQRLRDHDPAAEFRDSGTETTMDMRTAMIVLDRVLPADRAVVTDCGRFMRAPWKYLHVGAGGLFQHTVNFGSIGLGLATAIGAAVARPDGITVGVAGDGGAMMGIGEFTTAVREQLGFVAVILNDGSYGAEYTKLQDAGLDPKHSQINWPEFADLARDLGGHAITVRSAADLERAAAMVRDGQLPLLVDVKADPTVDIGILS